MYSVTKRIDFCYGHRLLDYDGICRHPHGHNAIAELEIRAEALDLRNMVVDFGDIKRVVKGWIDRELDHKMILRHDDPLVAPLQALGEPIYTLDSNPTVERIARLIFDISHQQGLPVVRVTVWETPHIVGHIHQRLIAFDLDGTLVDSRRDLADAANDLITRLGGRTLSEDEIVAMVGDGVALLVSRALEAAGLGDVQGALAQFLEIYDRRLLNHTHPYEGIVDVVRLARRHARVAVLTNKPLDATQRILTGLHIRDLFDEVIGGDGPFPRKPDPTSLQALMTRAGVGAADTLLVGDSAIDLATARRAGVRCCLVAYGFGFARELLTGDESVVADAGELALVIEAFTDAA